MIGRMLSSPTRDRITRSLRVAGRSENACRPEALLWQHRVQYAVSMTRTRRVTTRRRFPNAPMFCLAVQEFDNPIVGRDRGSEYKGIYLSSLSIVGAR